MPYSKRLSKILILTTALLLGIAGDSCGIMKKTYEEDASEYPMRQTRTPGAVWRNNGNHSRDWAKTKPNDDDYYDDRGIDQEIDNATDEQWKKLDIKLGRHDNKALYKEVKGWLGTPYSGGGHKKQVGTDCSGFVMSVYKAFGITVPRTSYALNSAGTGVSYEEARPGDVIVYAGHCAIYLGNGRIVHASSAKTGIKYGYATYRTITSVRRFV